MSILHVGIYNQCGAEALKFDDDLLHLAGVLGELANRRL